MNLAHLHIVLNHVPTLGSIVGAVMLIVALVKRDARLKRISFQVLAVMALLVIPTYLSGSAAQRMLLTRSDISQSLIEVHQNSAMLSLILMTFTGTFAWFGLWQARRFSRAGSWTTAAVLVLSVLTAAVLLRTANLGGKVSHPEVRYEESLVEETGWRAPFSSFANDNSWVWPASETLHFIGMTLLFGVALLVNLRMMGMMKSISFAAVHRLLPLGILGFILNTVTGMVFFIASPELYVGNTGFVIKIALLIPAGLSVIYFTAFDQPWAVGPEKEAPLTAKIFAICVTTSLLGVMYFGRMLPFLQN